MAYFGGITLAPAGCRSMLPSLIASEASREPGELQVEAWALISEGLKVTSNKVHRLLLNQIYIRPSHPMHHNEFPCLLPPLGLNSLFSGGGRGWGVARVGTEHIKILAIIVIV